MKVTREGWLKAIEAAPGVKPEKEVSVCDNGDTFVAYALSNGGIRDFYGNFGLVKIRRSDFKVSYNLTFLGVAGLLDWQAQHSPLLFKRFLRMRGAASFVEAALSGDHGPPAEFRRMCAIFCKEVISESASATE